jgi:hypothetical protein
MGIIGIGPAWAPPCKGPYSGNACGVAHYATHNISPLPDTLEVILDVLADSYITFLSACHLFLARQLQSWP